MFDRIVDKITSPKKVIGIDVNQLGGGEFALFFIELVLEKNEITIQKKWKETRIDRIVDEGDKTVPVFINFSGKGVLTKKANQDDLTISKLLPNIKEEDFYSQRTAKHISVVRRESVDDVLALFNEQNRDVLGISLNGFPVENSTNVLDNLSEVSGPIYSYQFNDAEIDTISAPLEGKEIRVGGDWLHSDYLIAYSVAFQSLIFQLDTIQVGESEVAVLEDNYKQKKLFKTMGMGVLLGVLFLLLINFFLFGSFRNTYQELTEQLGMYEGQIQKIETLEKEVESKNNFLTKTGWLHSSKASYYADQIGSTVPKSIELTGLAVNPVDKKATKKQKETVYKTNLLHVSGTTKGSITLNKWLKRIKELDWVRNAEVLNYSRSVESNNAEFTIEVKVNNLEF